MSNKTAFFILIIGIAMILVGVVGEVFKPKEKKQLPYTMYAYSGVSFNNMIDLI